MMTIYPSEKEAWAAARPGEELWYDGDRFTIFNPKEADDYLDDNPDTLKAEWYYWRTKK
jgi:hypothetical protein